MTTGVRGRAVALLAGILLSSALVAGCGDAGDVDEPANAGESAPAAGASSGSTSSTATDPAAEVWDLYDVGGHKLYMSCAGTGSPTVVYLHGWVDHSYIPHLNALKIRDLLSDDYRVCLYDRRNVGSSETVDAVQTPADMLSDMENVLRAGGAEPPYILMAASFGGLPAYSFLLHHPDEVAGMVFIDAMFPDELALDQYLPPQYTFRHYGPEDACCSLETDQPVRPGPRTSAVHRPRARRPLGLPRLPAGASQPERLRSPGVRRPRARLPGGLRQAVRAREAALGRRTPLHGGGCAGPDRPSRPRGGPPRGRELSRQGRAGPRRRCRPRGSPALPVTPTHGPLADGPRHQLPSDTSSVCAASWMTYTVPPEARPGGPTAGVGPGGPYVRQATGAVLAIAHKAEGSRAGLPPGGSTSGLANSGDTLG